MVGALVGLSIIPVLWFFIMTRWQRAVYWLVLFIPFSGAISLWMSPNKIALLFKDLYFVVPLYLVVFIFRQHALKYARVPKLLTLTLGALMVMVLLQMINPNLPNLVVPAIGLKVWAFYLPLIPIISAMINTHDDLEKLMRCCLVMAPIPCIIGLTQYLLAITIGYEAAIRIFYGSAAKGATQGFAESRQSADAVVYNIPSTFSFVTQYFGYLLCMVAVAMVVARIDRSLGWRRFARISLVLIIIASFLSGAEAAVVFVPMIFVLVNMLEGKLTGLMAAIVVMPILLLLAMYMAGLDPLIYLTTVGDKVVSYGNDVVVYEIAKGLRENPLGLGTGMNTGPARIGFPPPEPVMAENYYAKAINELGFLGLAALCAVFFSVILTGLNSRKSITNRNYRGAAAIYLSFHIMLILNSLKGWQIDLDPVNIYFWLFAAILMKLPYVTPPQEGMINLVNPVASGKARRQIRRARRMRRRQPVFSPIGPDHRHRQ